MLNYEADDLIATYTDQILKKGAKVTIVSSDKDLMQLFKKNVRIFDPIKNKILNLDDVKNKFGVEPNMIIDVQALVGDPSDNIPGVPGIGVKTAAELINHYKTLENLLNKVEEIKQNKKRESIILNKEKAILSKKLVTLKHDVLVKNTLESLRLKNINKEKLYSFLREMEFNRLLSNVISSYGEPQINLKILPEKKVKIDTKKYITIKKINDLDVWIKLAEEKGEFAVDTETNSLDPHKAELVGISLCIEPGKACYIPLKHDLQKLLNKDDILKKLKPLLEDKSTKKIGQNIKYDLIVFYYHGINLNSVEDTMLMSYTLDAGNHRHNMNDLAEIHLNHKTIKFKDLVGSGKNQITFDKVNINKATEYAAEDADITLRLYKFFSKRLKDEKLLHIYEVFEKPMINILAKMEIHGIKIDKGLLKKTSEKFESEIKKIEKKIFKISKRKFNIGSTKQLGEIMYNELKISNLKKTRKGSYATSASVLEDLAFKGHDLPKLILDWRQVSKLKNTYSDALPEHINYKTKRVHTSFLLAATTTGRLASSDPNLQNIPIKTEDGKLIRRAFISEPGYTLISADYNQIEMRVLADLADVKELKKAFKNNEDIHSLTASQVFNLSLKKVNSESRRKAKAINFGIIYGISQYGLAKQISVSNQEAADFLNSYFTKFPEIKEYMNSTISFCRKTGYVNNIFGRRCYMPRINDKNFNVRNFQERAAINAPIQSSAAEIMRLAMIRLDKKIKDTPSSKFKMLLQIHDELIFEVSKKEVKKFIPIVNSEMNSVISSELHSFSIPLTVDINDGDNWGILH